MGRELLGQNLIEREPTVNGHPTHSLFYPFPNTLIPVLLPTPPGHPCLSCFHFNPPLLSIPPRSIPLAQCKERTGGLLSKASSSACCSCSKIHRPLLTPHFSTPPLETSPGDRVALPAPQKPMNFSS